MDWGFGEIPVLRCYVRSFALIVLFLRFLV
ncbi:hypothetical protein SAMN05444141_1017 [Pseudovibrio denitrificans]|uniref:Uncharacterized protein n=1 Tax=Pseudovibrio denitrificans TaxID=258256 RepID=A0A1I6X8N0_9HYPH|nr:hypothetical protein SAMN05444141_1017 [Pseudovibrio denitrificans]